MARPTVLIEADFAGNSTWNTNLHDYIIGVGSGFSISRGVDDNLQYNTSEINFSVTNKSRIFTQTLGSSSLYGKIEVGVKLRVKINTVIVWQGHIISYGWKFDARNKVNICNINAQDIGGIINKYANISAAYSGSITVNAAMTLITNQIFPTITTSFDTSTTTLPFYWAGITANLAEQRIDTQGTSAWGALQNLADHDMGGVLFVNKSNTLVFKKIENILGVASPKLWGSGTNVLPVYENYEIKFEDIAQKAEIETTNYQVDPAGTVIMYRETIDLINGGARKVEAYETYEFTATYDYVASSITTPAYTTDYLVNSSNNGTGGDRQADLTFSFVNNGANGTVFFYNFSATPFYISKMQIRGVPASPPTSSVVFSRELAPPSIYNQIGSIKKKFDFLSDTYIVRDYIYSQLRIHRYSNPALELQFKWGSALTTTEDTAIIADMIALELYDLVYYKSITNTGSNVDDYFRVVSIDHNIAIGQLFETTVKLIPSHMFRDKSNIAWDDFDRPNTASSLDTSPTGHIWTNDAGGFHINNNTATPNTSNNVSYFNLGSVEQIVEVFFSNLGVTSSGFVKILFSGTNFLNDVFEAAYGYNPVNGQTIAFSHNGVSLNTDIVSYTRKSNNTLELRVVKKSNKVKIFADGKLVLSTSHINLSAAGTYCGVISDSNTLFDNIYTQGI